MVKQQLFIGAALVVGVAIGYFIDSENKSIPMQEEKARSAKSAIADKGESASVKALRVRIAELEQLLADREHAGEAADSSTVAQTEPVRQSPQQNWRARMEEMKEKDPVRYAEVTNRMARFRARMQERAQARQNFLAAIDTSGMSEDARKVHEELQAVNARREELFEQLRNEELTDEQRGELMRQLHETDRRSRHLNGAERENLLATVAENLGFKGDEAAEITATIQDVIEATDSGFGFGRHGGGRRGAPPPEGVRR